MHVLPSSIEVLQPLSVALGLELDARYGESHHRSIQRAAKGLDGSRPGSTALHDAVTAACDALIDLGGGDGSPSGDLVRALLQNATGLYDRLCLFLDVPYEQGTPPLRTWEVLLDRFAVPFLGVTVGEHVEAYYAGLGGLPALPGVLLRTPPDRVPRPLAWVLKGLARRCGVVPAKLAHHLDLERARLSEWTSWPADRAHTISPAKLDDLVRRVEARGGLENPDPLRLDRSSAPDEQAQRAAEYALGRYSPARAAEILATDPESLSDAARGEARREYALYLAAAADAEWRPWSLGDLRNELLLGRAIELVGKTLDAAFEAPHWPPGQPARVWFDEVWHLTAAIRRRARLRVRSEWRCVAPTIEEYALLPRMPFEAYDVTPRDGDEREALYRVRSMYVPVEGPAGILEAVLAELGEAIRYDPGNWPPALREAWDLVEPSRQKLPGDAQRVDALLSAEHDTLTGEHRSSEAAVEDPEGTSDGSPDGPLGGASERAWWSLVRARLAVQRNDWADAADAYERALKEAAHRTSVIGRIAGIEGLAVCAQLGRRRLNAFLTVAVRTSSSSFTARDLGEGDIERLSERLEQLFPHPYPQRPGE